MHIINSLKKLDTNLFKSEDFTKYGKSRKNWKPDKISEKGNHNIIHQTFYKEIWIKLKKSEILIKNLKNPEKTSGNRIDFQKIKSSYHILRKQQTFCIEIWLKPRKCKNLKKIRKKIKKWEKN